MAIDHLRKAGRWPQDTWVAPADEESEPILERLPAPPLARPDMLFVRDDDVRRVRAARRRLPEQYRLPLTYAAIDGLDYATIAVMLGVTVGSVKTLVFRARRMLKDEIADASRRD